MTNKTYNEWHIPLSERRQAKASFDQKMSKEKPEGAVPINKQESKILKAMNKPKTDTWEKWQRASWVAASLGWPSYFIVMALKWLSVDN